MLTKRPVWKTTTPAHKKKCQLKGSKVPVLQGLVKSVYLGYLGCACKTAFKLLLRYDKPWRHIPTPAEPRAGVPRKLYQFDRAHAGFWLVLWFLRLFQRSPERILPGLKTETSRAPTGQRVLDPHYTH